MRQNIVSEKNRNSRLIDEKTTFRIVRGIAQLPFVPGPSFALLLQSLFVFRAEMTLDAMPLPGRSGVFLAFGIATGIDAALPAVSAASARRQAFETRRSLRQLPGRRYGDALFAAVLLVQPPQ